MGEKYRGIFKMKEKKKQIERKEKWIEKKVNT
jgi:hypothetical protein